MMGAFHGKQHPRKLDNITIIHYNFVMATLKNRAIIAPNIGTVRDKIKG